MIILENFCKVKTLWEKISTLTFPVWITWGDSLDCFVLFLVTPNKSVTYAAARSVEVTLNYQTDCTAAQTCQQWPLELMTHGKQSVGSESLWPARAPLGHIINITPLWWALCPKNYKPAQFSPLWLHLMSTLLTLLTEESSPNPGLSMELIVSECTRVTLNTLWAESQIEFLSSQGENSDEDSNFYWRLMHTKKYTKKPQHH